MKDENKNSVKTVVKTKAAAAAAAAPAAESYVLISCSFSYFILTFPFFAAGGNDPRWWLVAGTLRKACAGRISKLSASKTWCVGDFQVAAASGTQDSESWFSSVPTCKVCILATSAAPLVVRYGFADMNGMWHDPKELGWVIGGGHGQIGLAPKFRPPHRDPNFKRAPCRVPRRATARYNAACRKNYFQKYLLAKVQRIAVRIWSETHGTCSYSSAEAAGSFRRSISNTAWDAT